MGLRDRSLTTEERCFFITITCFNRKHLLLDDICFQTILDNFRFYNETYKARLMAYVLLINHVHFVIYFEEENRLSDYMRDFKKFTSRTIRDHLLKNHTDLATSMVYEKRHQSFKIWDDRFDDVFLVSRDICETKINYIHNNPVNAGLVALPEDYPYSSAAFYLTDNKRSSLLDYREVF